MSRSKTPTQAWDSGKQGYVGIPDTPFYVLAEDSFMSGWGAARGQVNTVVVPCGNKQEIQRAMAYMKERTEMKRIRYVCRMPRPKAHVKYSIIASWAYAEWVQIDVRYDQIVPDDEKRFVAEIDDLRKEGFTDQEIAERMRIDLEKVKAVA